MTRALSYRRAGSFDGVPFDGIMLDHAGRHLRRKMLTLRGGADVIVDLPTAVALQHGDVLVLEDGRLVGIEAAKEDLLEIRADSRRALQALAWHIGNRHLAAQIEEDRLLIQRDHIIEKMLAGLGAKLRPVTEAFSPEHGAYHDHAHG